MSVDFSTARGLNYQTNTITPAFSFFGYVIKFIELVKSYIHECTVYIMYLDMYIAIHTNIYNSYIFIYNCIENNLCHSNKKLIFLTTDNTNKKHAANGVCPPLKFYCGKVSLNRPAVSKNLEPALKELIECLANEDITFLVLIPRDNDHVGLTGEVTFVCHQDRGCVWEQSCVLYRHA